MTSPVDFISGPSTVSTPWPLASRNRPKGSTASFTAMWESIGSVAPSPCGGKSPSARSWVMVAPTITRAAAFASGTAVAFDTKGTVRDALGLASRTYRTSDCIAYWTLSRPRTPTPSAISRVDSRIRSKSARPSVIGGRAHAESPEWTPASSMCSITPPRYRSVPS